MRKILLLIGCICFSIACETAPKKRNEEKQSPAESSKDEINNKKLIDSLVNLSINKGDTIAFNRLYFYYTTARRENEMLTYSITMAHQYNYTHAYFYIYLILSHPKQGGTINSIDVKTRNLALYYLLKSYEVGYQNARYSIEEVFGKNIPKSNEYLDKMKEK